MPKRFGDCAIPVRMVSLRLMMYADSILLLAAGLVFGGFLIIISSVRRSSQMAAYISIISLLTALAAAMVAIIRRLGHSGIPGQSQSHILMFNWLPVPATAGTASAPMIAFGISSGSLNLAFFMLFLVIALLTQVHALGMLKHKSTYANYFAMGNLTAFLLLLAALSINVMQMYLLLALAMHAAWCMIAWSNRPPENVTARRVLLPHAIADALFLVGIIIFALHGSPLDHQILFGHASLRTYARLPAVNASMAPLGNWFPGLTWSSLGGVCVVAAALVKSGQFPFHTWVPETITGFYGANAMLAGTVIAGGGLLLLAHCASLLNLNAALTVAMMGATTQFCASAIALVQKDIKRTLTWLLIAQTGLNFLFFGSGDYAAGLLGALLTALIYCGLFLTAGTVLRATGGQRDITQLGGAWRRLPITAIVSGMLVLGGAGVGLSGMTVVMRNGLLHVHAYGWAIGEFGKYLYWVPCLMCYVTAFAMVRWWWLIFAGKSRGETLEDGELAVQTFPLLVLLVGAIIAGEPFVDLTGLFTHVMGLPAHKTLPAVPTGLGGMLLHPLEWLGLAALAVVALVYSGGMDRADKLRRRAGPNLVYRWLAADMYVADLFLAVLVLPVRLLGRAVAFLDRWIVEWLMVTAVVLTRLASILVAAAETGLNISFWERLDRPLGVASNRLAALKRDRPLIYIIAALVVLLALVLIALLFRS